MMRLLEERGAREGGKKSRRGLLVDRSQGRSPLITNSMTSSSSEVATAEFTNVTLRNYIVQ